MLWTEEAVEVLKRLALEGRSASVIAAALGAASRGAVIGKANRIGVKLNGDRRASLGGTPVIYRQPLAASPRPKIARVKRAPALPRESKGAWSFADEVGEMRRVSFDEIHQFVCRWPVGDPTSNDFVYCGLTAAKGHSYCAGHYRMAYRPPKAQTRQSPQARRWSPALGIP